ncbi:MAG: hypothetical protein QM778_22190 [Myxococcales bacterium]
MNCLHRALLMWTLGCAGCITLPDLHVPPPEASTACNQGGLEVLTQAFPLCDPGICASDQARGHCVPPDFVQPAATRDRLASCSDGTLCVPVDFLINEGRYTPKACRSVAGLEGRCLSECLPEVFSRGDFLPRADCDPGERCAPCYDPTTGKDSGACSATSCDAPVEPKPDLCAIDYAEKPVVDLDTLEVCPEDVCAFGTAHCADVSQVPADQRHRLADCDGNRKCVPDDLLISGGNAPPRVCTAGGGLEGRCQSLCIPEVSDQKSLLQRDVCADSELCAPCYDPRTGKASGACSASTCDMPTQAEPDLCTLDYASSPLLDVEKLDPCPLSVCATGHAHCMEYSALPADQLDRLAECGGSRKCVPDSFLESGGHQGGKTCKAFGEAEGRCMSECLPEIASQKDSLKQEDCEAGELCAPCFNPVTGESTGACDGSCDQPKEGPWHFDGCCGGRGLCVPSGSVDESQRGSLSDCPTADFKCAPREYAEAGARGEDYVAPTCSDAEGKPGACISTCISSADLVGAVDSECPADTKCVPCAIEVPILSDLIGPLLTGACK